MLHKSYVSKKTRQLIKLTTRRQHPVKSGYYT